MKKEIDVEVWTYFVLACVYFVLGLMILSGNWKPDTTAFGMAILWNSGWLFYMMSKVYNRERLKKAGFGGWM